MSTWGRQFDDWFDNQIGRIEKNQLLTVRNTLKDNKRKTGKQS